MRSLLPGARLGYRFSVDNRPNPSLDDILAADNWARQVVLAAGKLIKSAIA